MSPQRIQRQRTKGWRMPPDAVYVGRPSRWGNPFAVPGVAAGRQDGLVYDPRISRIIVGTRQDSVAAFRRYVAGLSRHRNFQAWLAPLRGKTLVCWCPVDGQPCHADVLLELAGPGGQR